MKKNRYSRSGIWKQVRLDAKSRLAKVCTLLLLVSTTAFAQTQLQVVTKTIDKELPYVDGQRIRLTAQKADVLVKGWNRSTVSVRLRLIAKHPDREVADREVAYHQYTMQSTGNQLELANRFVIPKAAGKLKSQLKAVFEVNVPAKAVLTLTNSFGDVVLSDLSGEVTVSVEFGKLSLDDMAGKLTITSDYGDIDGRNVQAILVCKTQKAEVMLRGLGGDAHIQSRYGKLTIWPNTSRLTGIQVDAARTEVVVLPRRVEDFQYDVQSAYGAVTVPAAFREFLGKYMGKQRFDYQAAATKPLIKITNDYSPITIQALTGTDVSAGKQNDEKE